MACAQNFGVVAVIQFEASIKDIERAFPQSAIFELLGVTNDPTVDLVDLFETTILHDERQDFATNSAGAISDDRFVFEMVVSPALNDLEKLGSCFNRGDDGIFEFADCCFVFIATIKEDHFIATRSNKLIDFGRREVNPTADDSVFINHDFFGDTKRHDFIANSNLQAGKLVPVAFGPFVLHVLERREIFHDSDVTLNLRQGSANSAVDAIL